MSFVWSRAANGEGLNSGKSNGCRVHSLASAVLSTLEGGSIAKEENPDAEDMSEWRRLEPHLPPTARRAHAPAPAYASRGDR